MGGAALLPKAAQLYAWGLFAIIWAQMGWIDWKEQKIRNHYLLFWLKFILAVYLIIVAQSLLGMMGYGQVYLVKDYYISLLGHLAFSVGAAYTLWWLRIWPAGDVKLFVLLALFYPLTNIPGDFRSGLLFLEVMINIFVPAAAFLLLTAAAYLWQTRFTHYATHAASYIGFQYKVFRFPEFDLRAPKFGVLLPEFDSREGARAVYVFAQEKSRVAGRFLKDEFFDWLRRTRERPWDFFLSVVSRITMMAVMAMISYYLNDVVTSNVVRVLICFALMFVWGRICTYVGTGWALIGVFSASAIILWRLPSVDVPALAVIFGHITIFSLFIFLGMQLAFKLVAGKTKYMFLLPVLMMLPSLIPFRYLFGRLWAGLVALVGLAGGVVDALRGVSMPAAPPLPSPPAFPSVAALAWIPAADLSGMMTWAMMGLFFGLALVFVRIWDAESYKSVPPEHLTRFMSLGPAFVARIEEDEDFCEEHFSAFYADGLTQEQAEALKEWCRENAIETVPLAPTISFANWIFLGYFLTRVLEGHVLRFLY